MGRFRLRLALFAAQGILQGAAAAPVEAIQLLSCTTGTGFILGVCPGTPLWNVTGVNVDGASVTASAGAVAWDEGSLRLSYEQIEASQAAAGGGTATVTEAVVTLDAASGARIAVAPLPPAAVVQGPYPPSPCGNSGSLGSGGGGCRASVQQAGFSLLTAAGPAEAGTSGAGYVWARDTASLLPLWALSIAVSHPTRKDLTSHKHKVATCRCRAVAWAYPRRRRWCWTTPPRPGQRGRCTPTCWWRST
jgi:hypothetical protein